MSAHRRRPPRWVRRLQGWWIQTPQSALVRMVALGAVVLVVAALIVVASAHLLRSDKTPVAAGGVTAGRSASPTTSATRTPATGTSGTATGASSTAAPSPLSVPPKRLTVLFVGDTLTVGDYASNQAKTFRSLVAARIGHETGHPIHSVSAGGMSGPAITAAHITTLPKHANLAIVELGVDDLAATSHATFGTAYRALLLRIKHLKAKIVCVGVWGPTAKSAVAKEDTTISKACGKVKGAFVSVSGLYEQNHPSLRGPAGRKTTFGTSDGTSPNDLGHAALADQIMKAIQVAAPKSSSASTSPSPIQ